MYPQYPCLHRTPALDYSPLKSLCKLKSRKKDLSRNRAGDFEMERTSRHATVPRRLLHHPSALTYKTKLNKNKDFPTSVRSLRGPWRRECVQEKKMPKGIFIECQKYLWEVSLGQARCTFHEIYIVSVSVLITESDALPTFSEGERGKKKYKKLCQAEVTGWSSSVFVYCTSASLRLFLCQWDNTQPELAPGNASGGSSLRVVRAQQRLMQCARAWVCITWHLAGLSVSSSTRLDDVI